MFSIPQSGRDLHTDIQYVNVNVQQSIKISALSLMRGFPFILRTWVDRIHYAIFACLSDTPISRGKKFLTAGLFKYMVGRKTNVEHAG